ncbi:MAG TPA: sigma-70 family RNA polymerase sigma factor [Bacteroidales bacterium]|nr:sigma-70 family RNA polymerase sigma factor [Bacteroidales bacterium]
MVTQSFEIHKELIEQSKRGDRKSQYQLYSFYAKAMFNICVRMLNSVEEAEDVLQDAFCDAFGNLGSFRYESTFGAWLKRLVINHCINHIKKKKINLVHHDDMAMFDEPEETESTREDLEFEVKKIHEAMLLLPEGYRVIFSLYLIEGYDHTEISEILGISESTSKSQFLRAKGKIREILNVPAL